MLRNLGLAMVITAIVLAVLHYFIGFHKELGELARYFLGAHATYAAGSFVTEILLYLVFFFVGVWGMAILAGASKSENN
ncbi:MAG: hypothetical protein ACR2OR_08820 [Hyphomicrobiales bacterium]